MQEEIIEISVKTVIPTLSGCAVFLNATEKAFVIYVDHAIGESIASALQAKAHERPLTHELIISIFKGFDISLQQVVINKMSESAFFARIFLRIKNELGTKMIEVDARPSDAIALALQTQKPIKITREIFDAVEDMTETLENILKKKEGF